MAPEAVGAVAMVGPEPAGPVLASVAGFGMLSCWGDPAKTGPWAWHRFGGEIAGSRTFGGLTVLGAGSLGWDHGTDAWPDGEFFGFEITGLELVP